MALSVGTNCGFVTSAPSADPDADTNTGIDTFWYMEQFTAPAAGTVTEIGWWCKEATEAANFTVAISEDVGDLPEHILSGSAATAKGTTAGWKKVSGFTQAIVSGTKYWLGVCLLDTATPTSITCNSTGGVSLYNNGVVIPDPYVSGGGGLNYLLSIYALYTASGGGGLSKPRIMNVYRRKRG